MGSLCLLQKGMHVEHVRLDPSNARSLSLSLLLSLSFFLSLSLSLSLSRMCCVTLLRCAQLEKVTRLTNKVTMYTGLFDSLHRHLFQLVKKQWDVNSKRD